MEYIRIIGDMAGGGNGSIDITPEKGFAIAVVVVAAVIIGLMIFGRRW